MCKMTVRKQGRSCMEMLATLLRFTPNLGCPDDSARSEVEGLLPLYRMTQEGGLCHVTRSSGLLQALDVQMIVQGQQ